MFPSQGRPNFPPSPSSIKSSHVKPQSDAHLRMPNLGQAAEASQGETSWHLITRTATNLNKPVNGAPALTTGKIACSAAARNNLSQVGDLYTVDVERMSILSRENVRPGFQAPIKKRGSLGSKVEEERTYRVADENGRSGNAKGLVAVERVDVKKAAQVVKVNGGPSDSHVISPLPAVELRDALQT
jgi:hypothetical protein